MLVVKTMGTSASDLTGTLAELPASVLLTLALDRALSGSLHVLEPSGLEHHVRLRDGRPTRVRTTDDFARLGDLLVDRGAVSREDVEEAACLGAPLGDALELAGRVERLELERSAAVQLRARVSRLFRAPPTATFRLLEGVDLLEGWGLDLFGLDPLALILAGIREQEEEDHLFRTTLENVGGRDLRLHRLAAPARFDVTAEEAAAIEVLARRAMTLDDWLAACSLTERTVRPLAFALLLTRHAGTGEERGPVGVLEADPTSSQRVARVALRSAPSSSGVASEVRVIRNPDPRADPDDEPAPISVSESTFDAAELLEVSCELAEAGDAEGLADLSAFVEASLRAAPELEPLSCWLRSFSLDEASRAPRNAPERLLERLDALVAEGTPTARLCRGLLRYRAGDARGAEEDLSGIGEGEPGRARARRILAELAHSA